VYVRVRACVHACVHACACVRVCVHACVCGCQLPAAGGRPEGSWSCCLQGGRRERCAQGGGGGCSCLGAWRCAAVWHALWGWGLWGLDVEWGWCACLGRADTMHEFSGVFMQVAAVVGSDSLHRRARGWMKHNWSHGAYPAPPLASPTLSITGNSSS